MIPRFVASTIFTASESFLPIPLHISPVKANWFVFDAKKIDEFKAKVASPSVPRQPH